MLNCVHTEIIPFNCMSMQHLYIPQVCCIMIIEVLVCCMINVKLAVPLILCPYDLPTGLGGDWSIVECQKVVLVFSVKHPTSLIEFAEYQVAIYSVAFGLVSAEVLHGRLGFMQVLL